jgi:anti-sigma B factor antagonist
MDEELEIVEDELPGGVRRVALLGELDMIGAPEVEARLRQLAREGVSVRLDLSGLTFMDSTGVRVLFGAAKDVDGVGPQLEIVRPVGEVWRVIELTGLQRVLPFVDAGPA